jgi:MFS transporter, FSR family, fosmidomycin resistance protein
MKEDSRSFFLVLVCLWSGHLFVDFMLGVWSVYKTMAHLDLALAGIMAGGCALAGEGLQAVFGSLTDRGYRKHLMIGGLCLAASNAFLAYTQNYTVLFILFLLTCIGSGAFHPSAVSVINGLSSNRKALLMTVFQSGGGLGLAFSQVIFSWFFFALEGKTFILAIPAFALAFFMLLKSIGEKKSAPDSFPQSSKHSLKVFLDFFKNRDLVRLYISQVCNQSLIWAIVFLLPDALLSREYETWVCFGGAHLFFILGGVAMMIPAGYLADRYSCKLVIVYATLLGLFSFYAFLFMPMMQTPALCGLLFFLGAALGVISPVSIAFGNRLCPQNPGMVSAFLMGLVWCVSEGLGQGGGGLLTKLFEDDAPAKALGVLGLFFFIALFVSVQLPKEVPVPQTEYA